MAAFGMLLCWDDVFREKPFSLTKEQVAERLVAAHDVCLAQYGKGYAPEVIHRMRKWCREILDLYFLNVRPKGALPEEARGRRQQQHVGEHDLQARRLHLVRQG